MHTRTLESLKPQFLGLGQVVAFEIHISANASGLRGNDRHLLAGDGANYPAGGDSGFDPADKAIVAFVDPSAESNYHDGGTPASARILSNVLNGNDIGAMFEFPHWTRERSSGRVWLVSKTAL